MMKFTRQTHNVLAACHTKILFIILSMLVVLLGGLLTLFGQEQQLQVSHAADPGVVGPPSLPATTVDALFTRLGSPMAGTGQVVEEASRKINIDDAFALAVWWAETNDGMAGVGLGDRNPGGVQASPSYPRNGYTIYPSYALAVTDWFNIMQGRYISRGLTSVYTICYPYVGTSGALSWANKVMNYMSSYRALVPHPTPTPTHVAVHKSAPTPPVAVKPQTNTQKNITSLNKDSQPQMTQSTQMQLTGAGLTVAVLLAVPGLLINRKRRVIGRSLAGISMSRLTFQPEQATNGLPVTTTLRMEAISAQQLKPDYMNQYSPALRGETVNAINTDQLPFEFEGLPTIPVSRSFIEPMLRPVDGEDGKAAVPLTPLQRVPATPLFRNIPTTPLLPHSSQGGLLTRYNTQNRPRRIELTRPPEKQDQNC